jgi:uncharacterized membrane protein
MKPFYLLLAVFMLSTGISKLVTGSWNLSFNGNLAMSVMFCFTALGHFYFVRGMTLMIPAPITFKKELIYLTGIAEIILSLALLLPSMRYYAGVLLIVLLILITPANVYAALKNVNYEKGTFDGPGLSYLLLRIPLQIIFIAWIYYFSVKNISRTY